MLTRRGFAACALCAIGARGFVASEAAAQAPAGAVKRVLLNRTEMGVGNLVTLQMTVEVPAGIEVLRHTHPGVESAYVLEGEAELYVEGRPDARVGPASAVHIPAELPHGLRDVTRPLKLMITYVVDKDRPLVTLAPG